MLEAKEEFNNRTRVMHNGELFRVKKVQKMLSKFRKMTSVEQQSLLSAIKDLEGKKSLKKIVGDWTKKYTITEIKNKKYA